MQLTTRLSLIGAAAATALVLSPAMALAGPGDEGNLIHGDLTPSSPTDAPINGVAPGAAPWIIDNGEVHVRQNGRTDVRIDGLQISRNGSADNPIPFIDAVLYCGGVQVADSGPQPMTVPDGDAGFRVSLSAPSTCDAATVLISPSTAVGRLFIASVTGSAAD
jgi:hypothetical protein